MNSMLVALQAFAADSTADSMLAAWPDALFDGRLPRRVVVVSPHLDDAVMSLGATIAQSVQAGVTLEVLTVFGGDPSSEEPASSWDNGSGFSTEGQATSARREEDREACVVLGAEPRWLTFGAEPYGRHGSEDEIWAAVVAATRDADCVFLPGYPLVHRDHAELTQLLLRRGMDCRRIALYAEQPYSFYQRRIPLTSTLAPALDGVLSGSLAWTRLGSNRAHRRTKMQAVRAYQSQLRQLGLGYFRRLRMLGHEAAQGGEAIAWLSTPSSH
jgi:LmbE family N-acetylglucosaminyl deacetylase